MAKRSSPVDDAPPSAADQADIQLAKSGYRKRSAGEIPTQRELRAMSRVEKKREERDRLRYYATVPKGHYAKLAGRQQKVLNEQADRYKLPIGGPTVDLGAVLGRFHDLLREWARSGPPVDDESVAGPASPMLEKVREETWRIKQLERRKLEGELVDRADVAASMAIVSERLRRAGDQLGRRYGEEAQGLLLEAIEDIMVALDDGGGVDGDGADAA